MVSEPSTTQSPSITVAILSERFEPRVWTPPIWMETHRPQNEHRQPVIALKVELKFSATLTYLVRDLISQLQPGETLTLRRSDCADQPSPLPSISSKLAVPSGLKMPPLSSSTTRET
jgi:hypothetical protein